MLILALESSGLVASAALVSEDKVIGEYTSNFKKTHSQTLLPMMDAVLKLTGIDIKEIDAVAVSGGPGSFTGLRIGSATAKGMGLALDVPIINVPTLEAIAYNACGTEGVVCPLMDARRNQGYTGVYEFEGDTIRTIIEQQALPVEEIISRVNALGRKVIYLGDGVPVYRDIIEKSTAVPYLIAPMHMSVQRAGTLGALAVQYYKAGRVETAAEHHPDYLRPSQAEREYAEKHEK
ncbi:MAG: tRNA (adenosine(37)-N6)-threonylcarbamoyltransferase complex dimerization subunit type 1 TsaB [Lachnospiraceae bacterium]|nr:tRNA (adenosine(37)-N6)-threonylcarbamoyltransferase complex dimerization subunit type 1 TsaB [Lachnospiraceae bacterium]